MFDSAEYSYSYCPTSAECDDEVFPCRLKKGCKNMNKRRFSDEQIKSLETLFESETRLEPRKKLQLASELGLQPRQVAIWFQNKRARWKSKQLERDYNILLANYNNLASRFEDLNKEKQALVVQLQKLSNDLKLRPEEDSDSGSGKQTKSESESEEKPSLSIEKSEHVLGVLSDDDSNIKTEYFQLDDETELLNMNMAEPADSSLTSPDDWDNLNSETLFNESTSGYDQWWDFWS